MMQFSERQEPLYFSIVIPAFNHPQRLKTYLQSVADFDYPRDRFEVIVVDDGRSTLMELITAPFQESLNLTLLRQANAGPASARNAGAAIAKGEFIVFTDDDCVPASSWLTAFDAQFQLTLNALVDGQTLNALQENLYSTASQILIDYLYDYYNSYEMTANFFASNNFAIPTFQLLNGFDTTFLLTAGEDREFYDRWLNHGCRRVYAPEVQIYHSHQLNLKTFWRQHFNYGRGAFYFHQVRVQRIHQRIKVEPISFYFNLLTYPFLHPSSRLATQWTLSVINYPPRESMIKP